MMPPVVDVVLELDRPKTITRQTRSPVPHRCGNPARPSGFGAA
jgi:hypothetical protein